MVNLTIDGRQISVEENTTIMEAARSVGIQIPSLCYLKGINEIGACRVCVVELEGKDRLITACNNICEEGMVIYTNSPKVRKDRRTTVELILSEHDCQCVTCMRSGNCSLQKIANDLDILELIRDKKSIILYNKSDLDSKVSLGELSSRINSDTKIIKTSTKENTGFDEFSKAVEDLFFQGKIGNDQEVMITNMRHKQALSESLLSLQEVKNSLINRMPEDFYSIDLMNAYASLGRIIGEEIDDDLVTEIFSKFCMGK